MREGGGGSVLHSWRALLGGGPVAGLEDGPLLERFAGREGDEAAEAAFAALVARHGPMVRRVCRRLLGDPHDADDAFQATFLVLARKARGIQHPERLANWLYGTAHRASRRLRADLARRRRHEAARPAPVSEADPDRSEEAAIVLEEVAGLPRECRVAVVLCDLEGLTQEEAARRLGCSDRTLRRRLTHAHDLLRIRLTRRGLAPPGAILAIGSDPIPEAIIDATARAASRFAGGKATAGAVPASALILAEGVIKAMTWTKWKAIAALMGGLLALGGGLGVAWGFVAGPQASPAKPKSEAKAEARPIDAKSSPAERYKALVKRWDDALKVYQEEAGKAKNRAEFEEIYLRVGPFAKDHSPAFVALAEEFPADPVAVDALLWVANQALSSVYNPKGPDGQAFAKALEILARDHADEPRVGAYAWSLNLSPVSIKGDFLRAIVERSKGRAAKGRATLALAEYLRMEAAMARMFQRPDLPIDFDLWTPANASDEERRQIAADPASFRRNFEEFQSKYQPEYLKILKKADFEALRAESDRAYARVAAEFADVPAVLPYNQPTRETLGDVVRALHQPRPPIPPASRFKPLDEAFQVALKKAQAAGAAAGPGEPDVKAYIAASPKWADFGPKMWAIAEAAPRSPDGFDALLWIVQPMTSFDSYEDRSATIGRAVDALIADHLEYLGDHLDEPKIAHVFLGWTAMPEPHVERISRALFERGKTREIRGRMGLLLARQRKVEADLIGSLEVRGADPAKRFEMALFDPSYLDGLRKAGHRRLAEEAATAFGKVKAEYGNVPDVNGVGPTGETIATVADREIADLRTLAVGQVAPEIRGKDVDGRPMALSEFRGKVVLLDFGTHEHCGGCKLVYPRQRELVETHKGRPFAVLGINFGDRLEILKELAAKKEVTWRCWWDGDDFVHPGPITTAWNIKGYPTFVILDHRGVIRFKDLHPFDPQFDPAIEALIKEAEADRR
jgi:RNA polymerase sigma factor (sigma-70 family)